MASVLATSMRLRLVDRMCQFRTRASYDRQQELYAQGQTPRSVLMLLEGTVKLSVYSPQGRTFCLGFCGPQEFLGIAAAILRKRYETSAEAVVRTKAIVAPREAFLHLLQENAHLSFEAASLLSQERFHLLNGMGRIALSESARQRLAEFLLTQCRDEGAGANFRASRVTGETVAQMVGLSRETVSRLLSDFRKQGVVDVTRSMLTVRDWTGLRRLAGDPVSDGKRTLRQT